MIKGATELLGSKKGVAFSGTAATLVALILEGGLPVDLGSILLAGVSAVHILGQAAVDAARAISVKNQPKVPDELKDSKTGL